MKGVALEENETQLASIKQLLALHAQQLVKHA